ncbi:biotin-independent malonate decarboxylase subunit gamma [Legionella saoudiensis]|uniref:biotin-independent malonate decarboxylase subunit gamma n=1 Tax=Legionella saoudiensis TaxID=1750561 RepID=UPI0009900341|nr:biotin-independent malonate decarboxylase subunit gamma [Legionella saoudiensis]
MSSDQITAQQLIKHCFDTAETQINQRIIFGSGKIKGKQFNLLGTIENTDFGVDEAMEMAKQLLLLIKNKNQDPIILLTNVIGQKLSVRDEWLGMYGYFSHLLSCLHLARQNGNKLISLVYNQAIGGSFIAFGMMADRIYALQNTELAVMWLEGMAKVTKLDIELLREISKTSAVFAPGVENFKKLGGLHEVLHLNEVPDKLLQTIEEENLTKDNRAELGKKYGGRSMAFDLINTIENL